MQQKRYEAGQEKAMIVEVCVTNTNIATTTEKEKENVCHKTNVQGADENPRVAETKSLSESCQRVNSNNSLLRHWLTQCTKTDHAMYKQA